MHLKRCTNRPALPPSEMSFVFLILLEKQGPQANV